MRILLAPAVLSVLASPWFEITAPASTPDDKSVRRARVLELLQKDLLSTPMDCHYAS